MIRSLALLSLVAFAAGNDLWKAGFFRHFDMLNGFLSLPRTLAEAVAAGWQEVVPPRYSCGFDALTMYLNPSDTLVGIRYDEHGLAAGIQFCIPKSNVNPYYDMKEQGYTSWNATINNVTVEFWANSMFTVYEDPEARKAANNSSEMIRSNYVTVQGLNGTLDKVATNVTNIDTSIWTKQACYMWMGQHYFYNMTTGMGCDTPFYPWFLLYDEDTCQLIGMGGIFMGSSTCGMEEPSSTIVSEILLTAPECLHTIVKDVGVNTMHIYMVDHPRLITC